MRSTRLLALAAATSTLDALEREFGDAPSVERARDRFERYLELPRRRSACATGSTLDLTIVRGLAYYTGIVFELFDAKGEFRAICGGGRYDNLLKSLGGVDLPALGFGMGDVVLGELLRERGLHAVDGARRRECLGRPADVERTLGGATCAASRRALRRAGVSVEYALRDAGARRKQRQGGEAGGRVVRRRAPDGCTRRQRRGATAEARDALARGHGAATLPPVRDSPSSSATDIASSVRAQTNRVRHQHG